MRLEDLKSGISLTGIEQTLVATLIAVVPIGEGAVQVIYKTPEGTIKDRLLGRADEASISIATVERPWAFDGNGEDFKLAIEAKRIDLAFLFDPMMAVHTSNVEPLPHQITAVYESMLPRQPLRFVLADDPGAGKTIMAGLYIRELIMRADARRVLIVTPGSLVEQWRDELFEKFGLEFRIFSKELEAASPSGNPFEDHDHLIVRLDQMSRNEESQDKLCLASWDLVVFDEAHKLSAHFFGKEMKRTKRFNFAEKIGKHTRHLLLMTATPHNGKEEDFQLFLSLLDSDRFYGKFRDGVHKVDCSDLMRRMVKEEMVKFDGTKLFPERKAYTVNYKLSNIEAALYESVTQYVQTEMGKADQLQGSRKGSVGFALAALQRRLASSPEAIFQSLKRRKERLERRIREERLGIRGQHILAETLAEVPEDEDDLNAEEQENLEEALLDQATAARSISELEQEVAILQALEHQAKAVVVSGQDRKWDELSRILQNEPSMRDAGGHQRKLIIFSEHRDTLNYLNQKISGVLGSSDSIVTIHGGTHRDERRRVQALFRSDPEVRVLIATDAAGEGVNLQNANLMVNYDLPWNPNRLEQRFGRIHRIGQQEVCHLWNLVANETREGDVYFRLLQKLSVESEALSGRVFDILGEVFEGMSLKDLLIEAIRYGDSPAVRARLGQRVENAFDHDKLRDILDRNALAQETMSAERLFAVKEEMEKAEARRLQPYFVRSFFMKAFEALGGSIHPREAARAEIRRSWHEVCELNKDHPQANELFNRDKLPALHDPFAGGGTIPLEAQRLGLDADASDLNPVSVLINKAMIEIPGRFAGGAPLGPPLDTESNARLDIPREWPGATGLAEDVRRYGAWIRAQALKRIGHLYPPVDITPEMAQQRPDLTPLVGQKLTVIAWLWARTVKSPNPAFSHVDVPLASSFILSSKEGKDAYVQPVVEGDRYHFTLKMGPPPPEAKGGTTAGKRSAFICLMSGTPIDYNYIRAEGKAGRMGQRLMALVAQGASSRVYLQPNSEIEAIAAKAEPSWKPEMALPNNPRDFKTPLYGLNTFGDLFTSRQLVALTTFSDLVGEVQSRIQQDAIDAGMADDGMGLASGGTGATAYAEAICVYLAFAVSKMADAQTTLCRWKPTMDQSIATFGRQALPMVWDYSEANALGGMAGDYLVSLNNMMRVVDRLPAQAGGRATQAAAQTHQLEANRFVSTDPPYYDNINYADLSDFFYIWLRRALKPIFPDLLATLAVPKSEELVATPYRHGSREKAEAFFLSGMTEAMHRLAMNAHPAFPLTIYYAFKQSETETEAGTTSTGWETFLEAVLRADLALTGTWPMRTELGNRIVGSGHNVLASSIVLVCRVRSEKAPTTSRREFLRELNAALPEALDEMTKGSGGDRSPVAPVDLSQAIIGPGMAVFSKYAAVLEADGTPMSVRTALQLINRFLAEDDFDHDTQFCLHWFEQYGWKEGKFGDADTLARAKGTSVNGVREAGVVESGSSIVRLRKWSEYPNDWDPKSDARNPVWETLHHLIRALKQEGETGAGRLLGAVKGKAEAARQLAYRLYTLCERQGWADDARAYNELITSWTGIETVAGTVPSDITQGSLFE